ncbi:unnamed protein product [Caretta caretta]
MLSLLQVKNQIDKTPKLHEKYVPEIQSCLAESGCSFPLAWRGGRLALGDMGLAYKSKCVQVCQNGRQTSSCKTTSLYFLLKLQPRNSFTSPFFKCTFWSAIYCERDTSVHRIALDTACLITVKVVQRSWQEEWAACIRETQAHMAGNQPPWPRPVAAATPSTPPEEDYRQLRNQLPWIGDPGEGSN